MEKKLSFENTESKGFEFFTFLRYTVISGFKI